MLKSLLSQQSPISASKAIAWGTVGRGRAGRGGEREWGGGREIRTYDLETNLF